MLLFQEDKNASSGASGNAKELEGLSGALGIFSLKYDDFTQTLKKNIPITKDGIKGIIDSTSKLEDLSFRLTQETLGQTGVIARGVQETLAQAAYDSAQYGITLQDQVNVFKEINTIMQKNTMLTNEQQTNIALLANNAGVAAGDIATMVEAFDTIGVNTDDAIANISKMQQEARSYGINVGQFMKNIGSNIKLLNSYNFKNGVEGFSKMVAKAQALRIDFNKTVSLADSLLSPETAIETAAGFQMLGGAVGDLGDPFKLLHMAQTDIGGLQDSILGMAESAVSFNEKTGEFDIPVTEMYRLREAAQLTGMDYQELADTAVKSAERTKKLDLLEGAGLNDETKELVANLGEIQNGTVKIKLPGSDELVDATKLGSEEYADGLEKLKQIQEDNKLSDKEIALQQLSASRKLNVVLEAQVAALGPLIGTNTDAILDIIDAAGTGAEVTTESIRNAFSGENMEKFGKNFTDAAKGGFKTGSVENEKLTATIGTILNDLQTEKENFSKNFSEKIDVDSIFKMEDGGGLDVLTQGLNKFGITIDGLSKADVTGVLGALGDDIDGFIKDMMTIGKDTGRNLERGQGSVENDEEGNTSSVTPTSVQTTPTPTSNTNGGTALSNVIMDSEKPQLGVQDVNLNVGGTIDFAIDGTNLPQNISTEELASQIVNNPDFTSKLMSIFTDANNTYSV